MERDNAPETTSGENSHRTRKASLGEHVEGVLEDFFGMLLRSLRTVLVFSLSPSRAAAYLSDPSTEAGRLVSPYTFLLFGCLLYSYFLGAAVYVTDSTFTTVVWAIVRKRIGEPFSVQDVLIRSFPLLIGATLSASLAGSIFKKSAGKIRTLFVYIYGLQGIGLILFALSMSLLADALITLFKGDDALYLVIFPVLTIAVGVQGFRCLYLLTRPANGKYSLSRFLLYLAFPAFYLLPLPLMGYGLVASGFIEQAASPREYPVPPIRLIDAEWQQLDNSRLRVQLTAMVENRSKYTFVIEPSACDLLLYFVAPDDVKNWSTGWSGQQKHTFDNIEYFDRYSLTTTQAQLDIDSQESRILGVAPGTSAVIHIVSVYDVKAALFELHKWPKEERKREESHIVKGPLQQLADRSSLLVRLRITDKTLAESTPTDYSLTSNYREASLEWTASH